MSRFHSGDYWCLTSGLLPGFRILWRGLRDLRFVPVGEFVREDLYRR